MSSFKAVHINAFPEMLHMRCLAYSLSDHKLYNFLKDYLPISKLPLKVLYCKLNYSSKEVKRKYLFRYSFFN